MRRIGLLSSAFGLFVGVFSFGLFAAGCFDSFSDEHCDLSGRCGPPNTQTSSSSSSSSSTGAPAQCIPSMATGAVDNTCGIFVSGALGNDDNTGTKTSPVATLSKAIALGGAQGKPVYVCNEVFGEHVEVPAAMEIFGGLDCMNGWSWSEAGRSTIQGAADQIPLKLIGGAGTTKLENLSVKAADAVAEGGSSIAAVVDLVTAEISRCDFSAGTARDGMNGVKPSMAGSDGAPGLPGADACKTDPLEVVGGNGGTNDCAPEGISMGGKGGASSADMAALDGLPGADGTPADPMGVGGKGGLGGTAMTNCALGVAGSNGDAGGPGQGGTELGMISVAGISGGNGQSGANGKPGQGGGGGGGAPAASFCGVGGNMFGSGPSGGGGGAGGCGGPGGPGGQAGGSSIAMISLGATLSFNQVTLNAGNAGKGGNGALGQSGGVGGGGGNAGAKLTQPKFACKGGDGGYGGDGGSGGGARGGHSIGLAHKGANTPVLDGATITIGTPGGAGDGAPGLTPGGNGIAGTAANSQAFP